MRTPIVGRRAPCHRVVLLALTGGMTVVAVAAHASRPPPSRFAVRATLVAAPDASAAAGLALKARLAPAAPGPLVGARFGLSANVGAPAGACAIDAIFADGFEGVM